MSNSDTDTREGAGVTSGRVVLCGSMASLRHIERIRDALSRSGLDVVAPEPDDEGKYDHASIAQAKREASLRHIAWIKDQRTRAILVVNVDRDGRHDYIGPNAFAEIAIAFSEGRDVYLYQGIPATYKDELDAWGVTCLHGDLEPIRSLAPKRRRSRGPNRHEEAGQGALFASA